MSRPPLGVFDRPEGNPGATVAIGESPSQPVEVPAPHQGDRSSQLTPHGGVHAAGFGGWSGRIRGMYDDRRMIGDPMGLRSDSVWLALMPVQVVRRRVRSVGLAGEGGAHGSGH